MWRYLITASRPRSQWIHINSEGVFITFFWSYFFLRFCDLHNRVLLLFGLNTDGAVFRKKTPPLTLSFYCWQINMTMVDSSKIWLKIDSVKKVLNLAVVKHDCIKIIIFDWISCYLKWFGFKSHVNTKIGSCMKIRILLQKCYYSIVGIQPDIYTSCSHHFTVVGRV